MEPKDVTAENVNSLSPQVRANFIMSVRQRIQAGEDVSDDEIRNAVHCIRLSRADTAKICRLSCLIGSWKHLPNVGGVYEITTTNGPYVGQSQNIRKRIGEHVVDLEKGNHSNYRLQSVYDRIREQQLKHPEGSDLDEIRVKVLELAPITLTGDALTTWLLRREAYWVQQMRETGGKILNIARPEVPPFDHESFHDKKRNVEKAIERLPGEILSLQRNLPKMEEQTRAEISALEPKILEAIQRERQAQSRRWLYVGLILAVGLIVGWGRQDFGPFGVSVVVAAWFGIFGPRGVAARDEFGRLSLEQQSKQRALEIKRDEIRKKKKELAQLKRTLKQFKEEEAIFFAQ